jgi:hypothetical protein
MSVQCLHHRDPRHHLNRQVFFIPIARTPDADAGSDLGTNRT